MIRQDFLELFDNSIPESLKSGGGDNFIHVIDNNF